MKSKIAIVMFACLAIVAMFTPLWLLVSDRDADDACEETCLDAGAKSPYDARVIQDRCWCEIDGEWAVSEEAK